MPNRSRMVLLYSVRFSRRAVTRPGSTVVESAAAGAGPPCIRSIQPVITPKSVADNGGIVRGGIVPAFTLSRTLVQTSGFSVTSATSRNASRLRLPEWTRSLWQLKQFFSRIGSTVCWNDAAGVCGSARPCPERVEKYAPLPRATPATTVPKTQLFMSNKFIRPAPGPEPVYDRAG